MTGDLSSDMSVSQSVYTGKGGAQKVWINNKKPQLAEAYLSWKLAEFNYYYCNSDFRLVNTVGGTSISVWACTSSTFDSNPVGL